MTTRATLIFGAAMALIVAGCGDSSAVSPDHSGSSGAGTAAPAPPANQPSTAAAAPAPAPSSSQDMLSVLSVEHQVDIATERDGVVVSIARDEGSSVTKGDILGQLDDRTLQIELIKARDDLQVSQNNVKYKQAELKAKTAGLQRQQQLRDLGLSSQADLEEADFEAKAAGYEVNGWEANVESSQADIHRIEIELDQTRLRAPFSGAVVVRYVREGQQVAKGDKCFRVSQLSPLQVQFQIPESDARRPKIGVPLALHLVSDQARSISARVVKISPVVDPASDSYNVTAELTGRGLSDLRPGMAVRVVWPDAAHTRP
jgi:RND family efflux transporter MFP subunit